MKTTTIYVEAKKSRSFQTYTVGMTAELDENDDVEMVTKQLQATCRKRVVEQMDVDRGNK